MTLSLTTNDCVVAGTMGSLWQQAGRGGRGTRPSVAIFIALDSPLDQALIQNPSKLLQREVRNRVFRHAIL